MAQLVEVNVQIKCRSDVASNWTSVNPVLGKGEPGYETDTKLLKIGDGSTPWNDLDYINRDTSTKWTEF